MNIITYSKDVKYILLPKNYEALYNDLAQILSGENLIFAKPVSYKQQKYTDWIYKPPFGKTVKAVKFSETTDNEIKSLVADRLQTVRDEIERNVSKVPGLKPILAKLMTIPNNEYIAYYENEEGDYFVGLFAWGCVATAQEYQVDAVGEIIDKYQSDRQEVIVKLTYFDESPAADVDFFFSYNQNEKKKKTNSVGEKRLGKIKIAQNFEIYTKNGDEKVYITPFNVVEGQKYYELTIPFFTTATVTVLNQNSEPIAEHKLIVNYQDNKTEYTCDEKGKFGLENLEAGSSITVIDAKDASLSQTYEIKKEQNQFVFQLVEPVSAKIKVVDNEDNPLPNFEISVQYGENTTTHVSDSNAEIYLDKLNPGATIHVSEKKYSAKANFSINQSPEDNYFTFRIELPQAIQLKFRLIDHKKNPVANQQLVLTHREKEHKVITDENGYCTLLVDEIGTKDFVNMSMEVDKKQKIRKLKLLKK